MNLDDQIYEDWLHANHAWHMGDISAAEHIYKRLRSENCIELFYEVQLVPPVKFCHPLGTVLGRATYAPHLVCYQGVSVGSTVDHERPTFLGPCVLFPHSGVIGPVTVGKNVWITAGTIVEARSGGGRVHLPDNSVVFRSGPSFSNPTDRWGHKQTTRSVLDTYFSAPRG